MKIEIIHKQCGTVALYCNHRIYPSDVDIEGFTTIHGFLIEKDDEIYCPNCDKEIWSLASLTPGRDLDHREVNEKTLIIHSLN